MVIQITNQYAMIGVNKKKIVQISLGDGYAGSAKFAILSSLGFQQQGHEVTLIATEGSLTERRAQQAGLKIETLPTKHDDELNFKVLNKKLEALRPEFVIAHHSQERKYLMRFRRQQGRKFYSIAFRNIVSRSFPLVSSIPYNLWFDLNVACSKGVAKSLIYRGILPSKIEVVYNGIEPFEKPPLPIPKEQLDIPPAAKVIGISSWFHPKRKGFDILFSTIAKGLPFPFRIMMLGVIPDHSLQVEKMAQSFNVSKDKLIFPGYVNDIGHYYATMDVFVLPSREEGFSLSLLEAMVCGLPVIASDIPGNNELITHNFNGMLFSLTKKDQLRKALIKVITQPEFSKQIAMAAQKTVLDNFTFEKTAIKFDQVLEKLKNVKKLTPWN